MPSPDRLTYLAERTMADGRRVAAYEALLQRLAGLSDVGTREELFARLSIAVRELVPFDAVAMWLYEPSDQMLRRAMFEGLESPHSSSIAVPLDFGPGGRAFQSQLPVTLRLEAKPAPPVA